MSPQEKTRQRWERHRWALFTSFWNRVDRSTGEDECWLWTGSRNGEGYGAVKVNGSRFPAHRMALALTTGYCPPQLVACHRCDNPPCCNPAHLFWGTVYDNRHDCIAKGRARGFHRRIPDDRVVLWRRRAGARYVDLAREHGVSPTSVRRAAIRAARRDGDHV
jgi:hypothetical protein